jgi:putative nucleotidyltransferase with HDIG domain
LFVCLVLAVGTVVLVASVVSLIKAPVGRSVFLLAFLIFLSGRFRIKVPGRSAMVSVSEVFIFASLVLYGPGPAALTVAADGLYTSLRQRNRRLHRTLFNIAEPAISVWTAGVVFFATTRAPGLPNTGLTSMLLPSLAMGITYFLLNSALTALAVAIESRGSAYDVWRQHALYLALNSYAAASVATLAVMSPAGIGGVALIGVAAPLLALSYTAYKTASNRIEDSQRHVAEVEHLYRSTVETLAIAVDAKDQVTHGHIRRVQRHTVAVAKALGLKDETELKALEAASLLHDVGKLAVPDYVLNKPGGLSRSEFERMKLHAAKGAEILTAAEFPYPVVPIVRSHHEQWNGTGYPDRLSGEAIPFGARILTVVDCFDAVTSDRPYRRKMTDEEAIGILRSRSGSMYDPRVVEAFIELLPALKRGDEEADGGAEPVQTVASAQPAAQPHQAPEQPAPPPPTGIMACAELLTTLGGMLTVRVPFIDASAEACLFGLSADTDHMHIAHATALVHDAVQAVHLRVGEGLAGWVAANRHTILNSPPDLDLGDAALSLGLRTCTAVPVFSLGNLVAVLSVYATSQGGFSEAKQRAIGALAQEIGAEIARFELQRTGLASQSL